MIYCSYIVTGNFLEFILFNNYKKNIVDLLFTLPVHVFLFYALIIFLNLHEGDQSVEEKLS
jgi:hypothetical protein